MAEPTLVQLQQPGRTDAKTGVKSVPDGTWPARLNLDFIKGPRKTFVHRSHRGPLSMQRPFYPEGDVCHVTLLHPPGGVVSGDELQVNVNVRTGAKALVVTPGATKHYRSRAGKSSEATAAVPISADKDRRKSLGVVRQTLKLDGGSLEWLPNESIHFDGSETRVDTRIHLQGDARLIGIDVQVFGRHAGTLPFIHGEATVGLSVFDEGSPVLMDRLRISGSAGLHNTAGLRSYTVYATLVATHASDDLIDFVRNSVVLAPEPAAYSTPYSIRQSNTKLNTKLSPQADLQSDKQADANFQPPHFAVTRVDRLLVVRYLGNYSEHAMQVLRDVRSLIRPAVIGRASHTPRIWST